MMVAIKRCTRRALHGLCTNELADQLGSTVDFTARSDAVRCLLGRQAPQSQGARFCNECDAHLAFPMGSE
jgi:hypothetical protein